MVLIDHPYFNEPGFQNMAGTPSGKQSSDNYNRNVRLNNLKLAIIPALQKPPAAFKDILDAHFEHKRGSLMEMVAAWKKKEAGLETLAKQVTDLLENKYKPSS